VNVFVISPGRTATTTLSQALSYIDGYTTGHETNVIKLGAQRVDYPNYHIECDNRLAWFLPRLTKKYGDNSVLVIVKRDIEKIAQSYNRRWAKINIMKAYSQGILMRKLNENNIDVCLDYVQNVYEHLEYFRKDWRFVVEIDMEAPKEGVVKLLQILNKEKYESNVIEYMTNNKTNLNSESIRKKLANIKFNLSCLIWDLSK